MIDQRSQAEAVGRLPAFRSKVDTLRPTYSPGLLPGGAQAA